MNKAKNTSKDEVTAGLVDAGGRFAQDFGFSRIAGQVLMHLYLTDGDASLDDIEKTLGLSKAAVSMSCTQLESLGLIVRVRVAGDRKRYYRSAENLYKALTVGIAGFVRAEVLKLEAELQRASTDLGGAEAKFLHNRIERLSKLSGRMGSALGSPLMKLIAGMAK